MYVCYWNVLKVLEMDFKVLGCENIIFPVFFLHTGRSGLKAGIPVTIPVLERVWNHYWNQ